MPAFQQLQFSAIQEMSPVSMYSTAYSCDYWSTTLGTILDPPFQILIRTVAYLSFEV